MKFVTRITLLLFFFCAFAFTAGAVTASFRADVSSGCAPLVVHFTNTSTGATSYYWDLGNGTTSTLKDPSGTYLTAGTYTVKLVSTSGGTSVTYTMTITVYPLPVISFFADDTSVCPGTKVTFTSTTIGGVPGPMTYSWNFGDGFLGTGTPVTHVYNTAGYYNVTLTVTNSTGCINTLTVPAYMHVFNPPIPNFAVTASHLCSAPGTAFFTNLSSGTPALSYKWSFGDGGTSITTSPSHTYASVGSYPVKLVAKDGNGCIDSITVPGFITISNLIASFTSVSSTCLYSSVKFTNTTTGYTSCSWDFGDGATSVVPSPTHAYTVAGPYSVRLIVDDGYCVDTVIHSIMVNAGPVVSITRNPPRPCPPPVAITLANGGPSSATIKWIFGDGTPMGSGSSITHTYTNRGVDTIKMIATDPSTGCTDTTIRIDTFYDARLAIVDTPKKGCRPLKVNFSASVLTTAPDTLSPPHLYPWPITSYTWDFGDGSPTVTIPAPGTPPPHTYTSVGIWTVRVTALTSNGCIITDSVKVMAGDAPTVTGSAAPTHICWGKYIKIPIKVTSGMADEYFWAFSAPISSTLEETADSLIMYFPLPGTFTVTVSASYHGCMSVPYPIPVTMIVDSPMARMSKTFACYPRNTVNFFDNSLGDDTHLWIFGDGTTSPLANPVHSYPTLGIYTVQLATYNIRSGCRDTATEIIDLRPPIFDFVADRVAVCRDEIIHVTPIIVRDTPRSYDWYLNGTHIFDTFHVNPRTYVFTDTFFVTGLYTLSLVIKDHLGCDDTLTKTNYLIVAKPIAKILVTPPSGCRSLLVTFKDVSTDVTGVTLTNFDWTFGDGGTASVTTPTTTHVYTLNGSYSVDEIVTDNIGCKDTTHFSPIVVSRPLAAFHASNETPCAWDSTYFVNNSLDFVSSVWDFGDGSPTVSTMNTWHTYKAPGKYTVRLVVTDANGCKDTATYIDYIKITKPSASFHMSDSFAVCPPLTVVFYNTSGGGAIAYSWDFGDGNTSAILYPSDMYTKTGNYVVTLVAIDGNGCPDTAIGNVSIFGYAGAFTYTPLKGCSPLNVHFKSKFSNVASIIFDFADGVTSTPSTIDSADHVYTAPGEYIPKLILSDNTGCQNSSMGLDTIKVNKTDAAFTTEPTPVCERGTFNYKETSHSYFATTVVAWLWTFNNTDTSTLMSPTNSYSLAGTYPTSLRVTDSWGCIDSATQLVVVMPPPVIIASRDTIVCIGDGATMTGYGGVSYIWSPAATLNCTNCNPAIGSPKVVTTYTVTGTDKFGCTNIDTVTVRLKTKTISVGRGDTTVCFGVVVPLSDSGATKFTWVPAAGLSDPTSSNPLASPDTTTNYMVIAQLGSCIPDTNYVLVTIHPVPEVDAGPDQTMVAGMSADIRASGSNIYSISWGGDSTLSCNTCLTPKATPFQTTKYVIHVTSSFGCPNTDTLVIHIYCDKSQIFVPNAFTPNGDGENDVFYPRGRGISKVKSFRVYNRWGQLMFERSNIQLNDATNGWDGSYMGDMPRPDVFVYVVEAICDAGDAVNLKGDVTIIR
ncbi:MAG: hypothetical protein JWQ38_3486 [Flavipsychrobacter sp.]|nr:hypothetical protein [Flavipsychrobacter sp.]